MSSFFDIPDLEGEEKAFFVARYLDSPLIADGLSSIVDALLETDMKLVKGRNRHIRQCCAHSVNVGQLTAVASLLSPVPKGWTVEPIAPSDILSIANSLDYDTAGQEFAQRIADEQSSILSEILASLSISYTPRVSISSTARLWLARETYALVAQQALVAVRADGGASGRGHLLSSALSTTHALTDGAWVICNHLTDSILVGTYDMYLSLLEILRSRARVFIAVGSFELPSSLASRIQLQCQWQENWIKWFGNEGYGLAKYTEALHKAYLTSLSDPEFAPYGPYPNMLEKLREKCIKVASSTEVSDAAMTIQLDLLDRIHAGATLQEVTELFGLQKLSGHPFIYAARGGRSAAKEALEHVHIRHDHIVQLRGAWCAMFVSGFLLKHMRWPRLLFDRRAEDSEISVWYTTGSLSVSYQHLLRADWDGVSFQQEFDYDTHPNFLDLVDDKAISYYRDDLDSYWRGSSTARSSRRLLEELFSRPEFSMEEIKAVIESGTIPWEWKVVSLYPKEKEMKIDARMFAMLVLEVRLWLNCNEANLADTIYPYLAAQTMTKSKEEISSLFYSLTSQNLGKDVIRIWLECDLSRWNLRWRGDVVGAVGRDLNMLFGVAKMWTSIHPFFEESLIHVRTTMLRPDNIETGNPTPSDIAWYGHKGGFEGLAQKLWSICTYAMIQTALIDIDASSRLTGQGDNQVLSIVQVLIDPVEDLEQCIALAEQVESSLEVHCRRVNQDLKPDECLRSRTVVTYSKVVVVVGREIFLFLKFASKLHLRTSDEIPVLAAEIAGLHSAAMAAAENNNRPIDLYPLVAFYQTLELVRRLQEDHPDWRFAPPSWVRRLKECRVGDYVRILWLPASLGGCPVSTYLDYLSRGSGDPLARDISSFLMGCSHSPYVASLYPIIGSADWIANPPDLTNLLADPYSAPRKVLQSTGQSLQSLTAGLLDSVIKNTSLRAINSNEITDQYNDVVKALTSMRPLYPIMAHSIIGCTLGSETRRLSKMFTSTRTVQQMAKRAHLSAVSTILRRSAEEFFHLAGWSLRDVDRSSTIRVSVHQAEDLALHLRSYWGLAEDDLLGVDSCLPYLLSCVWSTQPSPVSGVKVFISSVSDPRFTRGPESPYFGHRTQMTRSQHGYKILGNTRPAKSIRSLQLLASMPGCGPHLQRLLTGIANSRGELPVELNRMSGSMLGGSLHHRFNAQEENRGAYTLGTGNLSTWAQTDTDNIDGVSGENIDFRVMFQEWLVYAIGLLNLKVGAVNNLPGYLEVTLPLTSMDLKLVMEAGYDLTVPVDINTPEAVKGHAMLYEPNLSSKIVLHSGLFVWDVIGMEVDPEFVTDIEAAFTGFKDCISEGLTDPSTVSDAIDTGGRRRWICRIGIAEAKCIGLDRAIIWAGWCGSMMIGLRLADLLLRGQPLDRLHHSARSICGILAFRVVEIFRQPALRRDPVGSLLLKAAEPKYLPNEGSAQAYIYGRIYRASVTVHRYSTAILHFRRISATSATASPSSFLLGCVGLIAAASIQSGLTDNTFSDILQSHGFFNIRERKGESSRQSLTYSVISKLVKDDRLPERAHRLAVLTRGRANVVLVKAGSLELLRRARNLSLEIDARSRQPQSSRQSTVVYLLAPLDDMDLASSSGPRQHFPPLPIYGSIHLEPWEAIFSMLDVKEIVLAGVGAGVVALAHSNSGGAGCIGIDLLKAYKIRDIRDNLHPVALNSADPTYTFSWDSLVYRAPQGIFEKKEQVYISTLLRASQLIVIDIRADITSSDLISFICRHSEESMLLVRFTSYVQTVNELMDCLKQYPNSTHQWFFPHRRGFSMFVLWIPTRHYSTSAIPRGCHMVRISNGSIKSHPLRALAISQASLALCGSLVPIQSLASQLAIIRSTYSSEINRESYQSWTETIARQRALECILEDNHDEEQIISDMSYETTEISTHSGVKLSVAVSSGMRRLCSVYVPIVREYLRLL